MPISLAPATDVAALLAKVKAKTEQKYTGVRWDRKKDRWRVVIRKGGKQFSRLFEHQEDAARVYDVAYLLLHGSLPPEPNFDGSLPEGITTDIIRGWLQSRSMAL